MAKSVERKVNALERKERVVYVFTQKQYDEARAAAARARGERVLVVKIGGVNLARADD